MIVWILLLVLCDGKTSIEYSGSPFVGVVQSVQDWARPGGASHRAQLRFRRLRSGRPMRTVLVVVADELSEHGHQVSLVEHDHVVQMLLSLRALIGSRWRARS